MEKRATADVLYDFVEGMREYATRLGIYLRTLARWFLASGIIGLLSGLLGTAFHLGVERATELRVANPWVLFTLPVAGLVIATVYHLLKVEGLGTDTVIDQVITGEGLSLRLLPAIFASTVLTHLSGGSAGREGAALQMGGTVGLGIGRVLHLDERDRRTATMAGMAAFFSALFGTPIAATIFAMGVITVGAIYHVAFVPCLIASLVSYAVSLQFGVAPTRFEVAVPEVSPGLVVRVVVLACLCGMLSALLCNVVHKTERFMASRLPNAWARAALGGGAVVVLTLVSGTSDYNGAGMGVIALAVEKGVAQPDAFAWKLVFTALTLGAGFKGGEVVPSFFIGATFGCTVGALLGIPPGFAAALGLVAVFCGAVNCPIASVILAIELFGADGLPCYGVACGFAFVMSGYYGLYSSQRILYDKLKARYIHTHANAYHEGDAV